MRLPFSHISYQYDSASSLCYPIYRCKYIIMFRNDNREDTCFFSRNERQSISDTNGAVFYGLTKEENPQNPLHSRVLVLYFT